MTEKTIERVRIQLLQQLHAVHPLSMQTAELHLGLSIAQVIIDADQVESELLALEEAGFVTQDRDPINRTRKRWKRTEGGRVYLADRNLANPID